MSESPEKADAPAVAPRVVNAPARHESLWTLRRALPDRYQWVFALALPFLLLFAWIALTIGAHPIVRPPFLVSPLAVLRGLSDLFLMDQCQPDSAGITVCRVWRSYLLNCLGWSALRIALSFFAASAVAIPLGILMGSFEPINRLFDPIVAPLRYMPISAFIPMFIYWFGIYEGQKIAFLFLGVFVYLLPVVVTAIRAVPEELVQTALTLGATRMQVIRTVLLPAALPDIFDSFRVMNAISWTYVILAEFVNTQKGLGYLIQFAGDHQKTDQVFAGILVIGIIGLSTDALIRLCNRVFFSWREQDQ